MFSVGAYTFECIQYAYGMKLLYHNTQRSNMLTMQGMYQLCIYAMYYYYVTCLCDVTLFTPCVYSLFNINYE